MISYACPVFHTKKELFNHTRHGTIVSNSTFVRVEKLKNHHKWVFDKPGTSGLACSKIEEIDDITFYEQIEKILSLQIFNRNKEEIYESLLKLESLIDIISREFSDSNIIAEEFTIRSNLVEQYLQETNPPINNVEIIKAYLKVNVFTNLLNVKWFILGRNGG